MYDDLPGPQRPRSGTTVHGPLMKSPEDSLLVVRLTPPGRGAIATIRVEGPTAARAVGSLFTPRSGRPLESFPPGRLALGELALGLPHREQAVVQPCADGSVELHCHGGQAVVAQVEAALIRQGCQSVPWQDWAALHESGQIAAEARVALPAARTERTAAILLDQYQGALDQALLALTESVNRGDSDSVRSQVQALLARVEVGRHLTKPWRVVLAGPPNAGKSSLINALLGYRRAIVHPTPGTTRDAVTAVTAIEGWPVELCDTAGLRPAVDRVEQAGVEQALVEIASADLVLLVSDLTQPWHPASEQLLKSASNVMVVHNKSDLPPVSDVSRPVGLRTSTLTGDGIAALEQAIASRLVPDPPPPGAAVPFTDRQIAMIKEMTPSEFTEDRSPGEG